MSRVHCDGALGEFVEIARGGGERRLLVVIAFHDGTIQFANAFHAFSRIRVVTDHVAQAHKMRAFALARVGQHGFERFEIGVDITENCETH